ncbi:MAG: acylphosphatase [bacterium]
MKTESFYFRVSGEVQGVGYRYYCRKTAAQFGLRGWVANMSCGDVEMEVFGDGVGIESFLNEITRKDSRFNVSEITKKAIAGNDSLKGFSIRE